MLLFVDVLEGAGHAVVPERDGAAAYARASRERFDVIILDIQVPGMRGDDVCRRLRDDGVRTPILALSARALPAQVDAALAAGFDRYLTKPVSPRVLREAVQAAHAAHGAGAACGRDTA